MIKRVLALLLVLSMVFALAACKKADPKPVDPNPDNNDPLPSIISPGSIDTPDLSPLEIELSDKASTPRATVIPVDNGMLAPAKDVASGDWGYINCRGEWVIKPVYEYATPFKKGFACVMSAAGNYSIIDEKGQVYMDKVRKLNIESVVHFNEGFANAKLGTGYEQTMIYIGIDNVTMLTAENLPVTSGVSNASKPYYSVAGVFVNNHAVVMRRTNAAVLEANKNNRKLVESKGYYESAYIINNLGTIVSTLPAGYDVNEFSLDENGIVILKDMTVENGLYYLCDIEGAIISSGYRRIEHCEGDLYLVSDKDNGFWGYVDKSGREVIPCKYSIALPFSLERAAVCEDDYWGVIDENGDYVLEPVWDRFVATKFANIDTNANMAAFESDVAVVCKDDYWAVINLDGEVVDAVYLPGDTPSPYKNIANGFIVYEENGLYGLLNLDGEIAAEAKFADIGLFNN